MTRAIQAFSKRIPELASVLWLPFAYTLWPAASNRPRPDPRLVEKTSIFIYFYLFLSIFGKFTCRSSSSLVRRFLNLSQCFGYAVLRRDF